MNENSKPQSIAQILAAAKGDKHALLAAVHVRWATMVEDLRDADEIMVQEALRAGTKSVQLFEKFEMGSTHATVKFSRSVDRIQIHFRGKYGERDGKVIADRTLAIITARQLSQQHTS